MKLRYQRPSWGRALKDQLLRFRATFINAIRHYDVIKAGNHRDRSRCSLSYSTFFNFSRTIRNTIQYNTIKYNNNDFTSPMLVTYPSLNCLISTSTSWLVPPQPYKGIWQQQESQVILKVKPGFPLLILMLLKMPWIRIFSQQDQNKQRHSFKTYSRNFWI